MTVQPATNRRPLRRASPEAVQAEVAWYYREAEAATGRHAQSYELTTGARVPPSRRPAPSRPLPPPPWPVKGLTQGAVVIQRLVEAVRALEGSVWALKPDQVLDAACMPRVLHRIDVGPGGRPLACRPEGSAQVQTKTPTQIALRVTLWDGEPRYVTSGGLLSRDRSHARVFGSEAEATQYAELHLDPKTERVISAA